MIDRIIHFSIYNKLLVGLLVGGLVVWGTYSLFHLPLDAVPDITDNQVQIITNASDLSAQEVERLITYPLELELGNIPDVEQIRSISRIGLSVITVVFDEDADIYWARQQIYQKIQRAKEEIPAEFGIPEMGPISTGLGEIYQYVVYPASGFENQYDATELRTIQDWIIKRQLLGIPGVVEVNSSGGFLKQYEIAVDLNRLQSYNLTTADIIEAVESNNENTGGSYVERRNYVYFIRGEGMLSDSADLQNILVRYGDDGPLLLKDVANVTIGSAPRFGAVTLNGRGEVVAGQVMMLKGANSMEVVKRVKERMREIQASLPEGIVLEPYLDRSKLINQTTNTVIKNLVEGALIVLFILVLFLGNLRAGLIVASVIPLSMLFAIGLMKSFGVSANLMSLGAIDFGLIVDGAVIIVEAILFHLSTRRKTSETSLDAEAEVYQASTRIRKSAAFGEIIILIVYLPILFLRGVEGKMFQPMAQTVSFAILGALILSLTYVPMMSALFLKNTVEKGSGIGHRFILRLQRIYQPLLARILQVKYAFLGIVLLVFIFSTFTLSRMGGEFIPTLEEGDFALHQILPAGTSIQKGVEVSAKLQDILMSSFPEVEKVVTKIGTPEIPTDIMPMEAGDIFVIMAPKSEWVSASSREEMFEKMKVELEKFPGVIYEFTQPIQMRFNELMTGVRQDIAIKIYGENLGELSNVAKQAERLISELPGTGDIQVERTGGLQYLNIKYDRQKLSNYGISIHAASNVVKTAYAGRAAGSLYEGERKFDIVVRLDAALRKDIDAIGRIMIPTERGGFVPLSQLAEISFEQGPAQISRDNTKRRITIGVNARNTDVATLIDRIKTRLSTGLNLPIGYHITYGGQFENLERARARLTLVVPIALLLIFVLLYLTFGSVKYALLIYVAIPLSAIGGIWALYFRGMPFSISAGVGFIALFGVAVLNGIVLVGYFNQLRGEGLVDVDAIIFQGTKVRLRPVLLTASVASLGFLPMALSTSAGAEVQRPLATVVIGGLITATILTLFVLPVLYKLINQGNMAAGNKALKVVVIGILSIQTTWCQPKIINVDEAVEMGLAKSHQADIFHNKFLALENAAKEPIAPLPLSMGFSGEEFNLSNGGVQSFYLGKSFRTGSVKKARKNLLENQGQLSLARGAILRQEIAYAISQEYLRLARMKSEVGLESDHLVLLSQLIDQLDRQVQLGAAGILPLQQAKVRQSKIQLQLDQLIGESTQGLSRFQEWLSGDVDIDIQSLENLTLEDSITTWQQHATHSVLQWQTKILDDQDAILNANQRPYFTTQFSLQSVNSQIPFFGYQLGVNIPLNRNYTTQQQSANEFNRRSLAAQDEYLQWQFQQRQEKLQTQVEIYRQRSERIALELIREAETVSAQYQKAFQLGEVSIADVFMTQDILIDLRKQYLDARHQYLKSKIDLKYLLIDFQ